MGVSVHSRVTRLERGPIGAAARCRLCGGLGRRSFRVVCDPDIPPVPEDRVHWPAPPVAEGCPACGRARVTTIGIRYDDSPGPREDRR